MMKKVLFYSFLNVFDRFRPCEPMRKHVFAGQNTQHMIVGKFEYWTLRSSCGSIVQFWSIIFSKMVLVGLVLKKQYCARNFVSSTQFQEKFWILVHFKTIQEFPQWY